MKTLVTWLFFLSKFSQRGISTIFHIIKIHSLKQLANSNSISTISNVSAKKNKIAGCPEQDSYRGGPLL